MIKKVYKSSALQFFDPLSDMNYTIPPHQREYAWSLPNWKNLFEDLTERDPGVFLGTVLCVNASSDSQPVSSVEIYDGCQRITTLSIMLLSLYVLLESYFVYLDDNERDLFQKLKRKLKDRENGLHLIPQKTGFNYDDYRALFSEQHLIAEYPTPPSAQERRIYQAFAYFKERIHQYVKDCPSQIHAFFELINRLDAAVFIVVEVATPEDAYALLPSVASGGSLPTTVDFLSAIVLSDSRRATEEVQASWSELRGLLGDSEREQNRYFVKTCNQYLTINHLQIPGGEVTRKNLLSGFTELYARNPKEFTDYLLDMAYYRND